jgi:hypothetical protein
VLHKVGAFLADFMKVQTDRFLLVGLFVFLYRVHADEKLLYAVIALLGSSMGNGRRFKY